MSSSPLDVASAIARHADALSPTTGELAAVVHHLAQAARGATPRPDYTPAPSPDHSALLTTALAAAGANPIARALAVLPASLPWHYHYAPRDDAPDLGARIGFAELIGPRGPLTAPDSRVGFTLMAPDTFYPLHNHPAVELYLVLSGTAEWIAPPSHRFAPPGALILHESNQPHAMRTTHEPLLALYAWSGDITSPAVYT